MVGGNQAIVEILEPGFLTTIQDWGRFGVRHLGIPHGGSADYLSAHIANKLVGNAHYDSVLECTLIGPVIKFLTPSVIALAGANMGAELDGVCVPAIGTLHVKAGAVLKMGPCTKGLRSYIAIAGGFDGDVIFGSRSTHLAAKIGGHQGGALDKGVRLSIASAPCGEREKEGGLDSKNISIGGKKDLENLMPSYSNEWVLRVVMGPELMSNEVGNSSQIQGQESLAFETISADMRHQLFGNCFQVMPDSNRMGLRLKRMSRYEVNDEVKNETNKRDQDIKTSSMYSSAVYPGTVQWPIGGEPILLGCDGQTVGGYPRLLQVIGVDLSMIGQIRPMDKVWFRGVSFAEARDSKAKKLAYIRTLLPDFEYM